MQAAAVAKTKKSRRYIPRCACGARKIEGACQANPPCQPKPHRRIAAEERAAEQRVRRAEIRSKTF